MTQFATVDPASGNVLELFEEMANGELEACLARCTSALGSWGTTSHAKRRELLRAIARDMRAQAETLAQVAVFEMGKPATQARAKIEKCARCCKFFAEHAEQFLIERNVKNNAAQSSIAFRPLGATLAIMPWNFPYWQVVRACVPAMAAGNGILLN